MLLQSTRNVSVAPSDDYPAAVCNQNILRLPQCIYIAQYVTPFRSSGLCMFALVAQLMVCPPILCSEIQDLVDSKTVGIL
jgi:hypothetical protein